ncbi:MAG: hydroxymethylglutaryl-CoA synthase [Holosporales bacterium]|jgi:hydroxymethylglutaryl-CoA synthase|nr:hydroxymethylglutaryl-CoA synthase [Holosporales bacterium]
MKIGIDSIGFQTAGYVFQLSELAKQYGIDPAKYEHGLMQKQMSVASPDEDVVTLGYGAAKQALYDCDDVESIKLLIFATETGVDQSKSAGMHLHRFLKLNPNCRVFELKQACYASSAALQLSVSMIRSDPKLKALIIASDIAKYGSGTPGEPTQGCGSVAMIVSANPKIMEIEPYSGVWSADENDFWRPCYSEVAFVDGKHSVQLYLSHLGNAWGNYKRQSGLSFADIDQVCYHTPFSKMAIKAHNELTRLNEVECNEKVNSTLHYTPYIGNCYTAALYVCLLSMLGNSGVDVSGKRVGMFAYGSGSVGEFFSGIVQNGYKQRIEPLSGSIQEALTSRKIIGFDKFREFYNFWNDYRGADVLTPAYSKNKLRLKGITEHKRVYELKDA